jgi:hypothetical protein
MISEMSVPVPGSPRTVEELLNEKEQELRSFEYN